MFMVSKGRIIYCRQSGSVSRIHDKLVWAAMDKLRKMGAENIKMFQSIKRGSALNIDVLANLNGIKIGVECLSPCMGNYVG